jgi:glycosyltransferase involved in cell wall biosynthesis
MKIYLPNNSKQSIGGGWSFRRNLIKGLLDKATEVKTWQEADVILITGATMTSRDEMNEAKSAGKPIVLRVDNMPKDSNNRGTAFSRMRDFSLLADYIVYQSYWASDYVGWWIGQQGSTARTAIIYNGVDKEFFYHKDKPSERRGNKYLFVRYNRDENKRFPEAAMIFHKLWRKERSIQLTVVGQFSPESVAYNLDFFAGENVEIIGPIEEPAVMGEMMRKHKYFLFPAYADASSNALTESLACGCVPIGINPEGGTIEIWERFREGILPSIQEMADGYLDIFNKLVANK